MFGRKSIGKHLRESFPSKFDAGGAVFGGLLLVAAFPSMEIYLLAYFALAILVFLTWRNRQTFAKAFWCGWIFGFVFFYGSCWWLTFAPIQYASIPAILAYAALVPAALVTGFFVALFAVWQSYLFKIFQRRGFFLAPLVWTTTEFLRFHLTGNAWNAIGYAFFENGVRHLAQFGGIFLVGFYISAIASLLSRAAESVTSETVSKTLRDSFLIYVGLAWAAILLPSLLPRQSYEIESREVVAEVVAVQPNVPMRGLNYDLYQQLQSRHAALSVTDIPAVNGVRTRGNQPQIIIFPESPMNFQYSRDTALREWLTELGQKQNASILFNSSEPSILNGGFYNSAVMVNQKGVKIAQYDKIRLMPFGEYVPLPRPFDTVLSGFVGTFERGEKISLMPFGTARAGVFICFESLDGSLIRQFTADGADVLVELTNDGYLGNTPVLRQHLSNAVFRAVESQRPVLRVTNTGITAYISADGAINVPTEPYVEDVRVWNVVKSDGKSTVYVRYGDWFAWLGGLVILLTTIFGWRRSKHQTND